MYLCGYSRRRRRRRYVVILSNLYLYILFYTDPIKKFRFRIIKNFFIFCILSHSLIELIPFLYQGIYVGNTIYYMLYIDIYRYILSSIYYKERIKNKKESRGVPVWYIRHPTHIGV